MMHVGAPYPPIKVLSAPNPFRGNSNHENGLFHEFAKGVVLC